MTPSRVPETAVIRPERDAVSPTQAQIDKADKLAVKIVTLVYNRISKDGKLYAYDGIEAAREIRRLILKDKP